MYCLKNGYLQKEYFFLELCPNSGLRKFRHGKSIVLSAKLIDACWPHWKPVNHTYDVRRDGRRNTLNPHTVYYTRPSAVIHAPNRRFIANLLANLLVKEFLKSVKVSQSYCREFGVSLFRTRCVFRSNKWSRGNVRFCFFFRTGRQGLHLQSSVACLSYLLKVFGLGQLSSCIISFSAVLFCKRIFSGTVIRWQLM